MSGKKFFQIDPENRPSQTSERKGKKRTASRHEGR